MVFSSLIFIYLFLPATLCVYYAVPRLELRNWVLIFASLGFYAWGEPVWISIMLVSAAADYVHGLILDRYRSGWQRKAVLVSTLVVNLGLLGFFKYWGFLLENLNLLTGIGLPYQTYGLPIGISFYTFQTISYVIDVYRGEVEPQRSFPRFLLFVSLFHQLVAGPVVRYKDIAAEVNGRQHSLPLFADGVGRFVIGLGKKVLLANTAGEVARLFLDGNVAALPVTGAWFGILMFTLQIYFDFSGYSDMAIGLGYMFGFHYKENFNYPYISRSATEFWRRWHISLGSFFRDYLYLPLGGNRHHAVRNLLAVWAATGLWHGASWNFVLWGLYYGFLIALERLFLQGWLERLPRLVAHLYLAVVTLVGWAFFYFTDLDRLSAFYKVMFGVAARSWSSVEVALHVRGNLGFLVAALVACTPLASRLVSLYGPALEEMRWGRLAAPLISPAFYLLLLMGATAMLVGSTYNPFLYFRF